MVGAEYEPKRMIVFTLDQISKSLARHDDDEKCAASELYGFLVNLKQFSMCQNDS